MDLTLASGCRAHTRSSLGNRRHAVARWLLPSLLLSAAITHAEHRSAPPTFTDVTTVVGVAYERVPSEHDAVLQRLMTDSLTSPLTMMDMPSFPMFPKGAPGVALFDYDDDGDLDIYVSNGPGAPNSLFASQLTQTGSLSFVDVAAAAGVDLEWQDSSGVCYGDIDNDGDRDLMVLGRNDPNVFFENLGDGTFVDATALAGVAGNELGSASCSFGDIDNDGLLDLVVGNTFDWASMVAIAVEPYALNAPNELYRNMGNGVFEDISATSGILENDVLPVGASGISWAVTMVDYDQDGDTDIAFADDQAAIPVGIGSDRGYIQVFRNDGQGNFEANAWGTPGSWMGEAWADFDGDGNLDVFATNLGDYAFPLMGVPYPLGEAATRALFGDAGGHSDPGVGSLVASTFGWGAAAEDFDNDGDTDVIYHGGLDFVFMLEGSNPGALLLNDGTGDFDLAENAFAVEHGRRMVQGVATGDLDQDGFVDIVSVASAVATQPASFLPNPASYGSPFDDLAGFAPRFAETAPGSGEFTWMGFDFAPGDLVIELNDGVSGGHSVTFEVVGGVDLVRQARTNRDGIGAVLEFSPRAGSSATKPVTGGSSFASAHALDQTFGLGGARRGTLETLWPGGVKNRLYNVRHGERLVIPEIPCSYEWQGSRASYLRCVARSLDQWTRAGVIDHRHSVRLFVSAFRALRD